MILMFDIGNQRIKWATSNQVCSKVSETDSDNSLESQFVEIATSSAEKELEKQLQDLDTPSSVLLSSVSSASVVSSVTQICNRLWQIEPQQLAAESQTGTLYNNYDDPKSLGVDRWCAAVGAHRLQQSGHVIVIDAGTAMTVDFIDGDEKCYMGGIIIPGIGTMIGSLNGTTDQIKVEKFAPSGSGLEITNVNTDSAVVNGAVFAAVAAVDRAIEEYSEKMDSVPVIFSTGGDAGIIGQFSKFSLLYEPALVFFGILQIFESSEH